MARGFLSGVIAGTLVSGLGLGAASVLTHERADPAPQPESVEVPAASGFSQSLEDTTAAMPSSEGSPGGGAAPDVSAPEPDDLSALQGSDTAPAAQPETGQAESALPEPAEGAGASGVELGGDDPVLPSPQAAAPEAPAGEEGLSISTDPAQPALSQVVEEEAAFPQKGEAETDADARPELSTGAENEAAEPQPDAGSTAPETTGTTPTEPVADAEAEAATAAGEAEPQPSTEQIASQSPEGNVNSSTIGDMAPEVETTRLPSVGDAAETEPAQEAVVAEEDKADDSAGEDNRPPLERFAAPFENPENKPVMSIVLIDDGSSPVGLQALEDFPYPLSFAVNTSWDGAEEAMRRYRAAGFEVLALTNLPETAGAQDAEQAMQAIFTALPEVVAVMEGTGSGLQSNREAVEQLASILLDSGHGAVLFPKGLNTAQKLLLRAGVPSAAVFRDFDAKGQDATVIRRFLDQAAFKAGQEEAGVVMLGRLRPDTVSALLLWGLQDRANRVALAPISALLGRGGE